MAEIPERFSRQQLLAGKSKWLKKPYRTTLAIFVYPCIVACVSYYGQMNKLWPKTWPKPKTMNAKTQALAE